MRHRAAGLLAFVALALHGAVAFAAAEFKIVTASERGTYIQIGRDIAKFVAPSADISLEVLPSAGSAENVRRLRYEPGVKFAMVQSDVYQAFLDQANEGNAEAAQVLRPLRVIMPLYNEEIYFIVRANAPFDFVHQIRDAKINVGPIGSGTALSATTLYRQMFGSAIPESNASFLSNEDALVKLLTEKSLDVVVVVAGQPAKLLVEMKPEVRQYIKLLKLDRDHEATRAALRTYFPATVRAANYPNLLTDDIPGIAVKAFLVTYNYNRPETIGYLSKFAASLCENFPKLQAEGHPKWSEVDLALPALGKGWSYFSPMERELRGCANARAASRAATKTRACSQQEQILGLCQ
ncbi:MAG: TAXI family TRAP transporter solute-binding subunit [Aromatoleum sp.]|jgi:TRAP transporter TAXI family solute receptor|uniref:TAXI family TRAP transporter solute-binding subunit n=1 Tax=Aromatoleum sp. TaxID=2307007 RepID=UPI002895D199|nr:TAXI family TRAP transporter solute-binding subunit [Aromatoleum sp.]MDT3669956.1 TAXI family TRAP transporter solute-binding subunit [Aromatoleum sp.]